MARDLDDRELERLVQQASAADLSNKELERLFLLAQAPDCKSSTIAEFMARSQLVAIQCALQLRIKKDILLDVVQNVLLKLWQKRANFQPGRNPRGYIYTITRRTHFDYLRHESRMKTAALPEDLEDHHGPEPANPMVQVENIKSLMQLLQQLSPEQRAAVTLVHLEGKSYQEAAQILNKSVSALGPLLHRARNELRDLYQCPASGDSSADQ